MKRDQIQPLADAGLPLRVIAERLGVSISTVRYWLAKHDLAELRRERRSRRAGPDAPRALQRYCVRHGLGKHVLRDGGYYRCAACRQESVARRRRRVKEQLVAEAGGACVVCGYSRFIGALQFHHVDPAEKSFGLGAGGVTRGIAEFRAEAAKCVLLCATCHAEVEGGFMTLPSAADTVAGRVEAAA